MCYSEECEAQLTEAKGFLKYLDELLQYELMVLFKARIVSFQWPSIYQSQIMSEVVLRILMEHNSSMRASCLKFVEHYEHLDDKKEDLLSREVEDVSSHLGTRGACSLLVSVRPCQY